MMTKSIQLPSPPCSQIGRKLESKTRKALFEYELISSPKVAVALSGGKDSLTLLLMLKAISGRGFLPLDLLAIHISGEYSCGAGLAENYLQDFCNNLDIELQIIESKQQKGPTACYSCARERRTLLFNYAKKRGYGQIAFGHHRDDSIETLFLNLLHKGEFAANLPKIFMKNYGVTIIRPLIFISEEDIKTFAQKSGFLRFMCQCPIGATSNRRTVKNLIENLERDFPNVRRNLELAAINYGSDKAAHL